ACDSALRSCVTCRPSRRRRVPFGLPRARQTRRPGPTETPRGARRAGSISPEESRQEAPLCCGLVARSGGRLVVRTERGTAQVGDDEVPAGPKELRRERVQPLA